MSTLLERIRIAQRDAAEKAVIGSIPQELLDVMNKAQAEHVAKGGCPGCGSMVHAVHRASCPMLEGDIL